MTISHPFKNITTRKWAASDAGYVIRISVLFACIIAVVMQFMMCFHKLRTPPITTHSHFDLNKSLYYPAITFCRDPPYKEDVLAKFGLGYHPRLTSYWRYFNYAEVNLDDVFTDSTYNSDEYFLHYGLHLIKSNVAIRSSINFNLGQCQTLTPQTSTHGSSKSFGYSVVLKHHLHVNDETTSELRPGWHVYIHDPTDNFTENSMKMSGRIEQLYLEVDEEVEIKLSVQQFAMMQTNPNPCTLKKHYSETKCIEFCQWNRVTEAVGCTGPWMSDIKLPYCANFTMMKSLIVNYNQDFLYSNITECQCTEPCLSKIYSPFVMSRRSYVQSIPSSVVHVYFSSKLVTVMEERPGYDFSQFTADMGGSLGFLTGLSVIGIIDILERIVTCVFGTSTENKEDKIDEDEESSVQTDGGSATTAELVIVLNPKQRF